MSDTAQELIERIKSTRPDLNDAQVLAGRVERVLAMSSMDENAHGQYAVGWNDARLAVRKILEGEP